MSQKYTSEQIEAQGVLCKFISMGAEHHGWIMPDGTGVSYSDAGELLSEPATIYTGHVEGQRRTRKAVAEAQLLAFGVQPGDVASSSWKEGDSVWSIAIQASSSAHDQCLIHVMFKAGAAAMAGATIETLSRSFTSELHLARLKQANTEFRRHMPFDMPLINPQGWQVSGTEWVQAGFAQHNGSSMLIEVSVTFRPDSAETICVSGFNVTEALSDDPDWEPSFRAWRHGGWYVSNLCYPSGASGCVSNNYPDERWRIVCDRRRSGLGEPGDFTFSTRAEASQAERRHIQTMTREALIKRPWGALVLGG